MSETKLRFSQVVFSKDNLNYYIAEFGGALLGYSAAIAATIFLKNIGFGFELNVLGTFVAMTVAFWIGNILTHRWAYNLKHKGPYPKRYFKGLIKSNVYGSIITGVVQVLAHYFLLKTSMLPYYLAPLIGYSIPGLAGSIYRHIKNYNQGIFSFSKKAKKL
ncbi:hypothetical protein KY341_01130 [Candidatus Woesearchaeota archaeon]|nr:hypothetical protein [Candidatus Woesearchaeota archaeon]